MPASPLKGIRTCVFGAYGTLFDYASATQGCRNLLGNKPEPLTTLWRDKQLQYTWLRSVQRQHQDFWQVTSDALQFSMRTLGLSDPSLHDKLMDHYHYLTLSPFPEVADTLQRIKAGGLRTAILSKNTRTTTAAKLCRAGTSGGRSADGQPPSRLPRRARYPVRPLPPTYLLYSAET